MSKENVKEATGEMGTVSANPTAPTPTTKTGVLAVLKHWECPADFLAKAANLDYDTLRGLVGKATKETVNAVFKDAIDGLANVKGSETMPQNGTGLKEQLVKVFEGQELSEEFKTTVSTLFEAAVSGAIEEATKKIEEEAQAEIARRVTELEEGLVSRLDKYASYVAESWLEENKLAVETGIQVEIAESFFKGFKSLLDEHYVEVPADKVDVVEGLVEKVETLTTELDESVRKNSDLVTSLTEMKKAAVFTKVAEGLALTDVEKLKTLSEKTEYVSDEAFEKSLSDIKETFIAKNDVKELVESEKKEVAKPATEKVVTENRWAQYFNQK